VAALLEARDKLHVLNVVGTKQRCLLDGAPDLYGRRTGCVNTRTSGSVGALAGNRQGHPARRAQCYWLSTPEWVAAVLDQFDRAMTMDVGRN
jgi:hypothetical protein